MRLLKGKVTEIRRTEHGLFAVIMVRDEMYPESYIYDHLHLACSEVTVVGDELSAPFTLVMSQVKGGA